MGRVMDIYMTRLTSRKEETRDKHVCEVVGEKT